MQVTGAEVQSAAMQMENDDHYDVFLASVQATFDRVTQGGTAAVYSTNAFSREGGKSLFSLWLNQFPTERQQGYKCMACRNFFHSFGHLVAIDELGQQRSVFWDEDLVPEFFRSAVHSARVRVENSRVLNRFIPDTTSWGRPQTGEWRHASVSVPDWMLTNGLNPDQSAAQTMADLFQAINHVRTAVMEVTLQQLQNAVTILSLPTTGALESHRANAQWLLDIKHKWTTLGTRQAHNALVREVALAPQSFRYVRSMSWYSLLDDLRSGFTVDAATRRFKAKLMPGEFRTAQTAPSEGNIKQAEELFERLGLAPALRRRYARWEDLPTQAFVWQPPIVAAEPEQSSKLFGHLSNKAPQEQPFELPRQTMTWTKFARDILPGVSRMELFMPAKRVSLNVLTTQAVPEAPPLLPWDSLEQRNPVAWFAYTGTEHEGTPFERRMQGSLPGDFKLGGNSWVPVPGVICLPQHFYGEHRYPAASPGFMFLLQGAYDQAHAAGGNALFAGNLRPELFGVRHVVEAHSRKMQLEGLDNAPHVVTVGLSSKANQWGLVLRVLTLRGLETVEIDRFE